MDAFMFSASPPEPDPPRDTDTLEMFPQDTDGLSVALFKQEGALLHQAELAAEALVRRVTASHPNVHTFTMSRDEMQHLSQQFGKVVSIAKEYHLDAAEPAA